MSGRKGCFPQVGQQEADGSGKNPTVYLDGYLAHGYNHADNLIGDEARQRNTRYRRKTNSFYHNYGRGFLF